jgi:hypothetical protein
MSLFTSVAGGFQMTFANRLTISVMFHGGNYCEHRDASWNLAMDNIQREGSHKSTDAEIAIWETTEDGSRGGRWIKIGWDEVSGYHTTDQVAFIIFAVSSAKNFDDLQSRVEHEGFMPDAPVKMIG